MIIIDRSDVGTVNYYLRSLFVGAGQAVFAGRLPLIVAQADASRCSAAPLCQSSIAAFCVLIS